MNELALFAGAGGSVLAGHLLGWRTVCAVELDPYCRRVLKARQDDGSLEPFPIWDDVRTFDGRPWRGVVDIVTAGFPCQPWSTAGKRLGKEDDRNLWPETLRVLREVGPRFMLLENSPQLRANDYFGEVIGGLAEEGYDARWDVISAAECGAPHLRKRLWIVAHANGKGEYAQPVDAEVAGASEPVPHANGDIVRYECWWVGRPGREGSRIPGDDGEKESMANANGQRREGAESKQERRRSGSSEFCFPWPTEPGMGRVADGVADRVVRLRALGNGWVPRVAARAWRELRDDD